MFFIKKIFLIILMFLSLFQISIAQDNDTIEFDKIKNIINLPNEKKYSLEEILRYTFENSYELNLEREKTKAVESLKFKTIGSNMLPNVGIDLNYGKTDFEQSTGSTKLSDSGNLSNNKIYLQQPIFKSGRGISQISITNNQINIQKNQLNQKEQEILFNAIMSTVNLIRTKQIYDLSLENEESLRNNYEYVLAKQKVGRATISESSLAEARYNSSRTNTINAIKDFLNARTLFLRITKIDYTQIDINFEEIFLRSFNYNEKFDNILNSVLNKNFSFIIAKENYELNKHNLNLTKSNFLPELYLNAELSKIRKTESIDEQNASVSLNLKVPLFQSGTEYANHKEASHLLNQSKFNLNNMKDLIINETITTYDEFLSAKSLIISAESYKKASLISLESTIAEEKNGKANIVDILDRRKEYYDTEILLLNYKTDVIKYYYMLKVIMGELNLREIQ